MCNRNQQEAIQALAESFPISSFSFLVLEREELPDVFWSLRIVEDFLGAELDVVHVGLFKDFTNSCSTEVYAVFSKLKGTKKCICGKGQIYEFCRAKPAFKREKDLTMR